MENINSKWGLPAIVFLFSFGPSLSPSILLSSKWKRKMFNRVRVFSAGLLLAILFMDFMPHIVEGGCGHSHGHSHPKEKPSGKNTHKDGAGAIFNEKPENEPSHSEHHHAPSEAHSKKDAAGGLGLGYFLPAVLKGFKNSHPGLAISGLAFILLILIDQKIIKHNHCDNEENIHKVDDRVGDRVGDRLSDRVADNGGHNCGDNGGHNGVHDHVHIEIHHDEGSFDELHDHSLHDHSTHNHSANDHSTHKLHRTAEKELKSCCSDGLKYKTTPRQALVFIFVFSIHSIFEGLAFTGNEGSASHIMFAGLVVHKLIESVSVGVSLFLSPFPRRICVGLLLFYSTLTPLGMILSMGAFSLSKTWLIREVCMGLAFGSLCFIVLVEMLPPIFHTIDGGQSVTDLLLGYVAGAILISCAHYKGK